MQFDIARLTACNFNSVNKCHHFRFRAVFGRIYQSTVNLSNCSAEARLPVPQALYAMPVARCLDRSAKIGQRTRAPFLILLQRLLRLTGFASMPSPLRVGIAGLGTVGVAVIRLLDGRPRRWRAGLAGKS